jgi:photoactive yellow protein
VLIHPQRDIARGDFSWSLTQLGHRLLKNGRAHVSANETFETITLAQLEAMDAAQQDSLPFGVVGLDSTTMVKIYNGTEAQMSGLDSQNVLGVPFFDAVGQCMNNFMVAQRFEDEPELDAVFPYVLTLRMRPTRVRLRLLASSDVPHRYILIER